MKTLRLFGLVSFVVVGGAGSRAWAQSTDLNPDTRTAATTSSGTPSSPPAREGFQLRLSWGFGANRDLIWADGDGEHRTVLTGIGTSDELTLGWSRRPGLFVGVGLWSQSVLSSVTTVSNGATVATVARPAPTIALFGSFVDVYPDSMRGLHWTFGGGVAMSGGSPVTPWPRGRSALGAGAVAGVGYDWWIGDHWSAGVFGRVMLAVTAEKDDAGVDWTHLTGTLPEFMFTLTRN